MESDTYLHAGEKIRGEEKSALVLSIQPSKRGGRSVRPRTDGSRSRRENALTLLHGATSERESESARKRKRRGTSLSLSFSPRYLSTKVVIIYYYLYYYVSTKATSIEAIIFLNLLIFLAIFIGLVRNSKVSYFLRFNALQSLLINIGIIIISFIFEIIFSPFLNSLIIRTFSSTLLISIFAVIVYCVWSCTQGNEPDLPIISEATKMQL